MFFVPVLFMRFFSFFLVCFFCLRFFSFFQRFFAFGQVNGNARHGRDIYQSFLVCKVNLATLNVAISTHLMQPKLKPFQNHFVVISNKFKVLSYKL